MDGTRNQANFYSDKMIVFLPTVLSSDILGCWVDLKSLVRLDSAYCNRVDRLALLSLLSAKDLIFQQLVAFYNPKLIAWLYAKDMKVSNIKLSMNFCPDLLSDYLRKWGSYIFMVDIGAGQTVHEMHLIAIHCKNLQVVRCEHFKLEPAFKELLWCNPNISEVWLRRVVISSTSLFDNVPLSKLSTLSISNSVCNTTFPLPITSVSNTLQKLQLGHHVDAELILKTVRLTPALKSLSLKDVQVSSQALIDVCSIRPTLLHLDVSGNCTLTSAGVLGMVRRLKMLRSISLHNCTAVSDRSIHLIANNCGDTLETIYFDVKDVSDAANIDRLQFFSTRCHNLHFLSIDCKKKVLCQAGGIFALMQGLPMLRTLVIDSEEVVCVSSRRFLEATHPKLQIVVDSGKKHKYNALDMPI